MFPRMNYFRTALLLAALTGFFLVVGYLLGGQSGLVIALVVALGMNIFAYWNSDSMVLRMANAQEVGPNEAPELYGIVQDLAQRGGLPMPRVYIIDDPQPNAFATGRNPENAAVAATTGILRTLTYEELAGVMAHELAHIKNHDTLTMTITATFAGAISSLVTFGMFFGSRDNRPNFIVQILLSILAPMAAALIQMAISRSREFLADEQGARLSGNPLALASALRKIQGYAQQAPMHHGGPATAHLFIINPFSGAAFAKLFSTHPPTEERIARLEAFARGGL